MMKTNTLIALLMKTGQSGNYKVVITAGDGSTFIDSTDIDRNSNFIVASVEWIPHSRK